MTKKAEKQRPKLEAPFERRFAWALWIAIAWILFACAALFTHVHREEERREKVRARQIEREKPPTPAEVRAREEVRARDLRREAFKVFSTARERLDKAKQEIAFGELVYHGTVRYRLSFLRKDLERPAFQPIWAEDEGRARAVRSWLAEMDGLIEEHE